MSQDAVNDKVCAAIYNFNHFIIVFLLPIPRANFHVRPQMARLGFLFNFIYLLNTHFNVSGSNYFFLTPIPEGEKNHLNRQFFASCRPQGSNPGLQRSKQVCYPLHHCLSGTREQHEIPTNVKIVLTKTPKNENAPARITT